MHESISKLFIGAPIEYESEYQCLRCVSELLKSVPGQNYVFANFQVGGRQIDFAVFCEHTTLIIEAKYYGFPVHGNINGRWHQETPYGKRSMRNAYTQALDASFALRDFIKPDPEDYGKAFVAICPEIPKGSSVTRGDFKVTVGALRELGDVLKQPSGMTLAASECENLARRLSLEAVDEPNSACDQSLLNAKRQIDSYLDAFSETYRPVANKLIPDEYQSGQTQVDANTVRTQVMDNESNWLITGPSGCGKSLLLHSCAMSSIAKKHIPVTVAAKSYNGRLSTLLDDEVLLLGALSIGALLKAARLIGCPVTLFVDGANECTEGKEDRLIRSLWAFSRRYGARLVISSQEPLSRQDLIKPYQIIVDHPSDNLKRKIARFDQRIPNSENLESLLETVQTGLEAELLGAIPHQVRSIASRFELFLVYARQLLSNRASESIRALSVFARELTKQVRFSQSIIAFDRLCDLHGIGVETRDMLFGSGILEERVARVSFKHEMYLNAFASEAVIRESKGQAGPILDSLSSPRYDSAKTMILGAIDDPELLEQVFQHTTDSNLILAAWRGECGSLAQQLASNQVDSCLLMMEQQIKEVKFSLDPDSWLGVTTTLMGEIEFSQTLKSYLPSIVEGLSNGKYLDAVLRTCRLLDEKREAFIAEVTKTRGTPIKKLRSASFGDAYVLGSNVLAITQVLSSLQGRLPRRLNSTPQYNDSLAQAYRSVSTEGELYCLVELTRLTSEPFQFASHIIKALERLTDFPYHLKLALIDICLFVRKADRSTKQQIAELLEASLDNRDVMLNSLIFDVLSGLGALEVEAEQHASRVVAEIDAILESDDEYTDQLAWGVYSCQFDHPLSNSYCEVINCLEEPKAKKFFTKACRGADSASTFFLDILIERLADFDDIGSSKAIEHWARLPEKKSSMPQSAIDTFIAAYSALGRMNAALPDIGSDGGTLADRVLLAYGELLYWAKRTNIADSLVETESSTAKSLLLRHPEASGPALRLLNWGLLSKVDTSSSLEKLYPDLTLEICRKFLITSHAPVFYFENGVEIEDQAVFFALGLIGHLGNEEDLPNLRAVCDDNRYGLDALKAIKSIENRTLF